MGHSHSHHHDHATGKKLYLAAFLNTLLTVAQTIGGIWSGSMALLSDAAHNFSDVLALLLSSLAIKLSGRDQTLKETFGYKRAGIFAAFINSATLMVMAALLIHESVGRLANPQPVDGKWMIVLAVAGIILNGISALLIHGHRDHDLNLRSAYLHLFTDMLTSVAVLLGGVAVQTLGWLRVDGVLTLIISIYLIYSSWGIFRNSIAIFMQFTPSHLDIKEIAQLLEELEGVKNVHHVHLWQLDDHEMMFEAHFDLHNDYSISYFEQILEKADDILDRFGIHHFNIQPEWNRKDEKSLINHHHTH